ncbi:hypothetical protein CRUP_025930 [Coryphaenoides rupestris]|nr:hypothetical protein CRUP_025930 [Coryphaenoides rupestris]
MALIEGVGDEVTLLFGLLLGLMVLVLAWASTHTAEPAESIFSPPVATSAVSSPLVEQHSTLTASTADGTTTSTSGLETLTPPPGEEGKAGGGQGGERRRSEGGGNGEGGGGEGGGADAAGEGGEGGERSALGDGLRRREVGAAPEEGEEPEGQRNMVVRLKFLNDTERTAQVQPQDTIGYIKRASVPWGPVAAAAANMALIEGVGDEVTLLFGLLLGLMVLVLAWASTHTAEPAESIFSPPVATSAVSSPLVEQHSTLTASTADGTTTSTSGLETLTPPPGEEGRRVEGRGGEEEERGWGNGEGGGGEGGGADAAGEGGEGGERSALGDGLRRREVGAAPEEGEEPEGQRNMVVRLKFLNDTERTAQGQLLQNDAQTLASLNLAHNCVLHCHVSQHAAAAARLGGGAHAGAPPTHQVQVALNVGSLMVPMFLLMLSVLWYCQIQYRHFFTAPATASLVGVTIFFSLVAFGVYRR